MARASIEIVEFDPTWPQQFRTIASALRDTLGSLATRIDHIGSTSVPGLAAKDVIDIQVTVEDLDEPRLRTGIEAAGLVWRRDIKSDHQPPGRSLPKEELTKRYAKADRVHCHIRQARRFNQQYALLCRDYLRTHPGAARAYEEIKRQLAKRFPDDIEAYCDIKDPVFDILMEGAFAWRDQTGWTPGATDA
ncbi:MAG: GrpB family protein [Myxococcales bacterium]|jgi:GrpB-like predicted nucleotidyltransferase (UPF0157 family)